MATSFEGSERHDMSCTYRRLLSILVFLLTLAASPVAAQSNDVRYVYDALGRLVAVIDQNGDAAIYTYDAVGNLLSIARRTAGDVQIAAFTPSSGPIGTSVTISGVGFSEVAAQNSVSFNGTAAAVTSATESELVVMVPAGATTGPISVVTPTGSSTSTTPFVVTEPVVQPTITTFSPTIGLVGTAVTVTGTGFDPLMSNDRLTFNGPRVAAVSGATQTELQTAVPAVATSGRLTIKTPAGSATSQGDFFVPPSPHTPSEVDVATRVTFGQQQTVSIASVGHIGLLLFNGAPGRRISISVGESNPNGSYSVFHPVGAPVETEWGGWSFIEAVNVPTTGTYTLMVEPSGSATGNFALTVYDVPPDASAALSVGGPPATVTVTTPGQNAYMQFAGAAGQRVGVQLSDLTVPSTYWGIRRADLQNLSSGDDWVTDDDPAAWQFLDVVLPHDGTYTVWFNPDEANTGSITAAAMALPSDVIEAITPGGPPVTVSISVPGQNARLTFDGEAGQRVAMLFSDYSLTGWTQVSILGPTGTVVLPAGQLNSDGGYRDTFALPVAGTYTILIDPPNGYTGNVTTTLYNVPPDLTGILSIGGASQGVTLALGQNAALAFLGNAGQVIALQMSGVSIAQSAVIIRNPDGSVLGQTSVGTGGGVITDKTLPATGTYTVTVDPWRANAGGMTLTLFGAGDIIGAITPGGPAVTVTIASPGQNARLSFEGTAGQRVSVTASGVTVTYTTVSILNLDGTTLGSTAPFGSSGGNFLDTKTLPQTGTYTLFLDPYSGYTGTLTVTLHNVVDVTGPIVIGGGIVPVTLTTPGQTARLTFDPPVNQQISVRATSVSSAFGDVAILRPDGSTLVLRSILNSSGVFIDNTILPGGGTYTVLVDPSAGSVGSLNLTLYDATDVIGAITAGGPAVPIAIVNPGQNGRLSFSGTVNQRISVGATAVTIASSTLAVLRPDGSTLASRTVGTSGGLLEPVVLPASGTYTVLMNPSSTNTGGATLTLYDTTDIQGTITPGGSPVTVNITTPGQNAYLTFDGAALQRVSLRATAVTMSSATLAIRRPDGTTLASTTVGTSGGLIDTKVLTAGGTYTVVVDPTGTITGDMTLTLYDVPPDVTGTLTVNGGGFTVSITTAGQNGALTFSGTAGQQVTVRMTGNTAGSTTVKLLRPDGTQQTASMSSATNFNLPQQTLAMNGTYTISIDPAQGNTGSLTISVTNP